MGLPGTIRQALEYWERETIAQVHVSTRPQAGRGVELNSAVEISRATTSSAQQSPRSGGERGGAWRCSGGGSSPLGRRPRDRGRMITPAARRPRSPIRGSAGAVLIAADALEWKPRTGQTAYYFRCRTVGLRLSRAMGDWEKGGDGRSACAS